MLDAHTLEMTDRDRSELHQEAIMSCYLEWQATVRAFMAQGQETLVPGPLMRLLLVLSEKNHGAKVAQSQSFEEFSVGFTKISETSSRRLRSRAQLHKAAQLLEQSSMRENMLKARNGQLDGQAKNLAKDVARLQQELTKLRNAPPQIDTSMEAEWMEAGEEAGHKKGYEEGLAEGVSQTRDEAIQLACTNATADFRRGFEAGRAPIEEAPSRERTPPEAQKVPRFSKREKRRLERRR